MACTRERSLAIGELCGARLDAAGAAELLEHVERCGACSEELDLAADLVRAGAGRAQGTVHALPRRRRVLLFGLGAGLAAAALLVLFLGPRDGASEQRIQALARLAPPPAAAVVLRGSGEEGEARDQALRFFAAGDFAAAAGRLAQVVESAPGDALAWFYLGVAHLQQAPDEAALAALRCAAERGEALLAEHALWYLAQAHLARAEGAPARRVLVRLIELDGDYEPNARALLAELDRIVAR